MDGAWPGLQNRQLCEQGGLQQFNYSHVDVVRNPPQPFAIYVLAPISKRRL